MRALKKSRDSWEQKEGNFPVQEFIWLKMKLKNEVYKNKNKKYT